jgi:gp16 family phage-associated protein
LHVELLNRLEAFLTDLIDKKYPEAPSDFPRIAMTVALPGVQPKFSVICENGKYYAQGMSPSQVADDYLLCEDIAQQMISYFNSKKAENKLNSDEILLRVYQGLIEQGWCRPEHNPWVIRRLAVLVNIAVPSGIPESMPSQIWNLKIMKIALNKPEISSSSSKTSGVRLKKNLTPLNIEHFRNNGMTIADWAREKNFNPRLVYVVLRNERKCLRGESHRIALELGMK